MTRKATLLARRLGLYDPAIRCFQAIERVQRRRKVRRYFDRPPIRKLQIGAGANLMEGWLNTEWLVTDRSLRSPRVTFLDATRPFPFGDGSFHYVYSEHVLEHFSYDEGVRMLREAFRVFRPGGRIRVATPNLEFVIRLYDREKTDLQRRYIRYMTDYWHPELAERGLYEDTFVINNLMRDWGHRFIYDPKILRRTLHDIGFESISQVPVGASEDPHLRGIESRAKTAEAEYNELETMVFEASRPERAA